MFEEGGLVDEVLAGATAAADVIAAFAGYRRPRFGVLEEPLSGVKALVEAFGDLPFGKAAHDEADLLEDRVEVAFPVDEFELARSEPRLRSWLEDPLPDGQSAAEPGDPHVAGFLDHPFNG